jgi:(+)-trans-carveol dehydrogenase
MTGRLEGRVAFVTGAARGQGRSHALRLAAEGADIIAVDRCADIDGVPYPLGTREELAQTEEAVGALGRKVLAEVADVRVAAGLCAVLAAGVERFGRLDVVCANAGVNIPAPAHEIGEAEWQTVLDVNLGGSWRTAKAAVPYLVEHGGSIVLTSSAAGLQGYANIAHYTAAKHGINGLMKTLAQELAPYRIRVNSVNPTQVDTPMIMNDAMYRLFCPDLPAPTRADFEPVSQQMNLLPIPWVDPVDVSNAVLFLASDEARYITGVALPVDAGVLIA